MKIVYNINEGQACPVCHKGYMYAPTLNDSEAGHFQCEACGTLGSEDPEPVDQRVPF